MLGRGRGLASAAAVAKCNAAGGAAATQRHKKSVKLREEGERYCTRMRQKECLTDGMEFHHAKERRTIIFIEDRSSAGFVAKCDLCAQIPRDCQISIFNRIMSCLTNLISTCYFLP